jgi:Ser/Thr protein kinase RdoA (MazF antagonist)
MGTDADQKGGFAGLSPERVVAAVEAAGGEQLDGTVERYTSYVNRVYGLRTEEERRIVAKFYRPGRWSAEAIADEHQFVNELAAAEVPVVAPWADADGDTLFEVGLPRHSGDPSGAPRPSPSVAPTEAPGEPEEEPTVLFALFPQRGGRTFDAERDEDWFRLGAITARMHLVGRVAGAPNRTVLDSSWTRRYLDYLWSVEVVHPDLRDEFFSLCGTVLDRIAAPIDAPPKQRIHGDCRRGNILDRSDEGLLLIDFDDMMVGPVVQDIWLLLPGRAEECERELTNLLEGYETFAPFDRAQLDLIEGLRFMRMIHFLAWRALQRHDDWFRRDEPEWGNRAFWTKEIEDLQEQARYV